MLVATLAAPITARASCGVGLIATVAGGNPHGAPLSWSLPAIHNVAHGGTHVYFTALNQPELFDLDTVAGTMRVVGTFASPYGMAVDVSGHVVLAETGARQVVRIDPDTGARTVVAGNGQLGFSGDGGPATMARLLAPTNVAIDELGRIYVVDGARIRRIGTDGIITTIAGTGTSCDLGSLPCGDGGQATAAKLDVADVAIDGDGHLFVAEPSVQRVRRIDADTGVISTVAGTGVEGFSGDGGLATAAQLDLPVGVAVDAMGDLYVADLDNNRIRRVSGGVIDTVAGGGMGGDGSLALAAAIWRPQDLDFDAAGNLFVGEEVASVGRPGRLRRIDGVTTVVTTLAGNGLAFGYGGDGGPADGARLADPRDVAVDASGNAYLADGSTIRRIDAATEVITTIGGSGARWSGYSGDGGLATDADFSLYLWIDATAGGDVFVADGGNLRIRKIEAATGQVTTVAGNGSECTPSTAACGDGGAATSASLGQDARVAVDDASSIYVGDKSHRLRKVAAGTITTIAGDGIACGIPGGGCGDGGLATAARFGVITALATGPDGDVYVADHDGVASRVRRIDVGTGTIATVAGTGLPCSDPVLEPCGDGGLATASRLSYIVDLAVDASGRIVLAAGRVRSVETDGTIRTLGGGGELTGEYVPAALAALPALSGVAVEAGGAVLVTETFFQRLRRITSTTGCGNCTIDPGETCDDGNASDLDACKSDCTANTCGDSAVYVGQEVCDDGDTLPGGCAADCQSVAAEPASSAVGGSIFTVTTDTEGGGDGATPGDPVETSVTVPVGTTAGTVSIVELVAPPAAQPGFVFLGTQVDIDASTVTPAPTAATPLVLEFLLDASQVPPDQDAASIVVQKTDEALVTTLLPSCVAPGVVQADPAPSCVAERVRLPGGDVRITVYTATASAWSFLSSVCGSTPQADCQPATPGKAKVTVKDLTPDAKDQVKFGWKAAGAVPLALLGQPTSSTDYTLCIFDQSGLRMQAAAPAGGTCAGKACWKTTPTGFAYADKEATPGGLTKLAVKASDAPGKAKLSLKGKGANLDTAAPPLALPARVQVRASAGACFGATFSAAGTKRNGAGQLVGRSD